MDANGRALLMWLVALASLVTGVLSMSATVTVEEHEVELVLGEGTELHFLVSGDVTENVFLTITTDTKEDAEVLGYISMNYTLEARDDYDQFVLNMTVETQDVGKVTLQTETESEVVDVSEAFVIVSVMKDPAYETAGMVLGWISTIAWDISFLPQIWHNYRRNSVEGLSFDFLTFNLLGFSCYLMFNAGLFWIPAIKDEFRIRHPNEVLHVRLNDVIFPLYAVVCTAIQIIQCFVYPKAVGQRVSLPCRIISCILLLLVIIGCILVPTVDKILWLDILYFMSYVKLFISMIKYAPQLYTNFKAKSTAGWSIGQVILDFTGGVMSLVQMFLIAANYDDYNSVLSDPTKLGLGLLSIFFNIFFFIQHYWLYRGNDDDDNSSNIFGNKGSKDEIPS